MSGGLWCFVEGGAGAEFLFLRGGGGRGVARCLVGVWISQLCLERSGSFEVIRIEALFQLNCFLFIIFISSLSPRNGF